MNHLNKLVMAITIAATGCNNNDSTSVNPGAERTPVEVVRNGAGIDYTDQGTGDTTLLFVHGWAINKTYWTPQVDFFRDRYRVVAIDLPGFGNSGKNRDDWSVENYGKDISLVIDKLGLKNVVLIGHSMSGAIVVEAALQNPGKVIRVIGVDNFKGYGWQPDSATLKSIADAYLKMRTNYKTTIKEFAEETLFSDSTKTGDRTRILNDFYNTDSVIAVNVMERGDQYPLDSNIRRLKTKLFFINSDYQPNDTASFIKNNIPYRLLTIHATGHYPMIEKPAGFNRLLQQALIESPGE